MSIEDAHRWCVEVEAMVSFESDAGRSRVRVVARDGRWAEGGTLPEAVEAILRKRGDT